jgi:hypothetical protein
MFRASSKFDFHVDGSGTVISLPVFSSGPAKMRLNNMGLRRRLRADLGRRGDAVRVAG